MPNWCYNSLTIEGSQELIADVKRMLNRPFVKNHENFNMETRQMEFKDYHFENPVFAFHNIYNHRQDGITDEEYSKQSDHTAPMAEQLMFLGKNWYDWNVRNWGTKWDVAVSNDDKYPETELVEESETILVYRFNTAWSPPIEAITKLSEQYPSLEIDLSFEEETGWGGSVNFNNGIATEEETYDSKCRDCDALNTMEYCENDCGEICSECKYLGEADMECVAECEVHSELANIN